MKNCTDNIHYTQPSPPPKRKEKRRKDSSLWFCHKYKGFEHACKIFLHEPQLELTEMVIKNSEKFPFKRNSWRWLTSGTTKISPENVFLSTLWNLHRQEEQICCFRVLMANSKQIGGKKRKKNKYRKGGGAGIYSRPNITTRRDETVLVKTQRYNILKSSWIHIIVKCMWVFIKTSNSGL